MPLVCYSEMVGEILSQTVYCRKGPQWYLRVLDRRWFGGGVEIFGYCILHLFVWFGGD